MVVALSLLSIVARGNDTLPSHRMVVNDSGFTESDPSIYRGNPVDIRMPVFNNVLDSFRNTASFLGEDALDDGVILLNGRLSVGGGNGVGAGNASVSEPT